MQKTVRTPALLLLAASLFSISLNAQDTIRKLNGMVIPARVLEVGVNAVSFKKSGMETGPTFVENKTDLLYIRYANGQKEVFNPASTLTKAIDAPSTVSSSTLQSNPAGTMNMQQQNMNQQQQGQQTLSQSTSPQHYQIQYLNRKFTVNGQKAKRRDVDHLLETSTNPAVLMAYKTTKGVRIAQKIIGITSIPSTIGGGVTSVFTATNLIREMSKGPASVDGIVSFATSFVGTLAFPITNKILKKKKDKLYNKTIDLYNATN